MDNIRILVVDNEPDWREFWHDELNSRGGFSVHTASTFLEATQLIANNSYEGAILDKGGRDLIEKPSLTYDYHDGLKLIQLLKAEQPFCRIVLETGEAFSRTVFDCGAAVFLDKGNLAIYDKQIIEILGHGALRPEEIGLPILELSGNESYRRGRERW